MYVFEIGGTMKILRNKCCNSFYASPLTTNVSPAFSPLSINSSTLPILESYFQLGCSSRKPSEAAMEALKSCISTAHGGTLYDSFDWCIPFFSPVCCYPVIIQDSSAELWCPNTTEPSGSNFNRPYHLTGLCGLKLY